MTPELITGLEVILIVAIATSLFIPLFCWVLSNPWAMPSTLD